ncbi:MAG TPA: response regulator, partial [Deltaproteobacteria bacterium]|nr:response regulator [Deltaproteobacteria bacterium]
MSARVLLVDDDPSLREVVRYALDRAGYEVIEASN